MNSRLESAIKLKSFAKICKRNVCKKVRGMPDRFGIDCEKKYFIQEQGRKIAELFGFQEIQTPILEHASLFLGTLGDASDVASKEIYSFNDRSNNLIAIRPEGTAGVARALISNEKLGQTPLRYYYYGPMFRYERPQKGRLRQFDQFGLETIGTTHPSADVEGLLVAWKFIEKLGLSGISKFKLNTLGDHHSRENFVEQLKKYLANKKDKLSEDSKIRLEKNPLRILDSKDEQDKELIKNGPKISEYLSAHSKEHFDYVLDAAKGLGISFEIDNNLVRGLDYYDHTVFELVTESTNLGISQNSILAGGRYNGLYDQLGVSGHHACFGWGAGVDRILLLIQDDQLPTKTSPVHVIVATTRFTDESDVDSMCLQSSAIVHSFKVLEKFAENKIPVKLLHSKAQHQSPITYPKLSSQLKSLENEAQNVVVIGNHEAKNNGVRVRNSTSKKFEFLSVEDAVTRFKRVS